MDIILICNTDIYDLDEGITFNPFPNEKYGQEEQIGTILGSCFDHGTV